MSAVPPAQGVWVDERLVVRESPIEGRGLFAADAVASGTVVIRLGGRLVSSAELDVLIAAADADPAAPFVDTITISEDAHLVLPVATLVHFGNHSCDPTLWHVGPFEVAARRDLSAGEEATIDYGTQSGADGFAITCRCRSQGCRGRVTSEDWRLPDLQERYAGHWVPALQQRIDSQPSEAPWQQLDCPVEPRLAAVRVGRWSPATRPARIWIGTAISATSGLTALITAGLFAYGYA